MPEPFSCDSSAGRFVTAQPLGQVEPRLGFRNIPPPSRQCILIVPEAGCRLLAYMAHHNAHNPWRPQKFVSTLPALYKADGRRVAG